MKKIILLSLILFTIQIANGQILKYNIFEITLGNCFKGDTVSLKINDKEIFNHINATTGSPDDAGWAVYQGYDGFWIKDGLKRIKQEKMIPGNLLTLDIKINNRSSKEMVNLDDGRYFLLNYCPTSKDSPRILSIKQIPINDE